MTTGRKPSTTAAPSGDEPTLPVDTGDPLAPGSVVGGRYRIEAELGRGGFGVVFRARDENLDFRPVVVKVLLAKSAGSEWVQKKFEDERRALVRLNHPNIVTAFDCGLLPDGRPFLVMELISGRALRERLEDGPLALEEVVEVTDQTARALGAAHARGIYHRDLKPENIMMQDLGGGERLVKVIDFGIATVKESENASTQMTRVVGTPSYMAPEQLAGSPSAASDTWALAVIAYEMLTGTVPFKPRSAYELLPLQREGVKELPSALRQGLSRVVDDVILGGLSFDPQGRSGAPSVFARDLAHALEATAPGATRIERLPRPGLGPAGLRRGWRWAALGVLVVCGAIGAAFLGRSRLGDGLGTAPRASRAGAPQPALTLTYAIDVQKYRNGKPYREPFRLPGEMLFGVDDRVRVVVSSPEPGYLYIINEGPLSAHRLPSYNLLFPTTSTNDGTAALPARREVSIPEKSWFMFDEQDGVEKLWLIWSGSAIPELEAVKRFANPRDRGVISGDGEIEAVRRLLATHSASKPVVRREGEEKKTVVQGRGRVLVSVLALQHH